MSPPIEIVGLGEVLWDLLPGGRQLGGAPGNFTFHCHQLAWDDRLAGLLSQASAVCFGTLMQRHATSRQTILRALAMARSALVVFDINLRQDFYSRDVIEASLAASRWVKLNDDELNVLRDLLGLKGTSRPQTLAALRSRYDLELACLTRGGRGCLVQTADEE